MQFNAETQVLQDMAAESAATLRALTGVETHDVAVVLGSGWVPAADLLGTTDAEFPNTELPHFTAPAVDGHAGTIKCECGRHARPRLPRPHPSL